ncbi:hypothetical protein RHMOL_Rhmol05G0019200 [Rhododendron molle]|uniref:Uncharacterized protein n=1 Tax=Rhododendron molle TaxID=49168 RepID=A0ACC0NJF1_RHOML|nr:hypothetical protein RHMOL_Rhmol05G0019200 [Rhododendron molle]
MSQPNSTHSSQNPVMQQQKVIIPNNNGEKLVGILHESGSVEIVILCHGFRSTKESDTMVNLAVALEKEGITVFRFDFSGNGESEGSFNYGHYWSEAEDLRAVIHHFSGMSRRTSAILGHSKGGNVVLLYASKYHDIPTVVNVSGRYDLKKGIEERMGKDFFEQIRKDGYFDFKNKKGEVDYRVTQESLTDRLNTKMHDACLQIDKNCRVLTVHGSADDTIPVDDAVEFAKIIPNHKLHVVQGADHCYTKHQTELASVVLPFIKEGIHKGMVQIIVSHAATEIIIPNTNGEKLVGILHETGSVEIVIVCHGFRSTKEDNTTVNLAVALETEGITAFRFDFSGIGESEGSFHFGNYRSDAENLRAVIQHFSGASRLTSAIVGHSKGGDVVLLYASKYHDVPSVVNVSGRYNFGRGIEDRMGKDFFEIIKKDGYFDVKNRKGEISFRVTEESWMDCLNTNMHEACLQIDKNCRVLTVHGSADELIPVEDALEFAKIIPNHKLHIVEGAYHTYNSHQTELASVVLAFIKEGLHKVDDAVEFANIIPNHKLHVVQGADHGYTKHQTELASVVLPFIKEGIHKVIQQQKVIIPNNNGEKLVGILHETGSVEIVILCHGFRSSKEFYAMVNLAVALEKEGITVFRFDFSGSGESEGSFNCGCYWSEVEDLRAVIQHFSGTSRRTSAILGHSKGGSVVLLYASKYHDIPTVVNVSSRYDFKKGIEEHMGKDFFEQIRKDGYFDVKNKKGEVDYQVTQESLTDRLNTKMHDACLQIDKNCRVLTVHGSADDLVPVDDAVEFAKIIPNHKLHVVQGANHAYTKHQIELASVVLPFIKEGIHKVIMKRWDAQSRFFFDPFEVINPPAPSHQTKSSQVRLTPSTTQYRTKRTLKMSQPNSTQNPVMRQQKIIIPNTNGEKLVGILHETGSVEIVIVCHGFRSTKEDNTMVNLAVALETEGITAFRFDFSGNGESEGSFHFGNYRSEAEDLRAVIQYFSGASRITSAIVGHSKGGDVVLLYASKYHDIPTVVNVSGRHNLERGIEERVGKDFFGRIKKDGYFDVKNRKGEVSFRVTEESLMDRLNTNMHEACLQIDKNCRVLTVHGSADEVIPVEDALEFAKIIPNHKLHIVEGANHNYTSHQTELASVVLAFIKEGLHKGA